MKKLLIPALLLVLSACGADGPPERPVEPSPPRTNVAINAGSSGVSVGTWVSQTFGNVSVSVGGWW